jgi:hypothetical protein
MIYQAVIIAAGIAVIAIPVAHTRERERIMTLFKVTKLIHDRFGIFINPIDLKPKMIYLTIKAKLEMRRG